MLSIIVPQRPQTSLLLDAGRESEERLSDGMSTADSLIADTEDEHLWVWRASPLLDDA
jgi:hypothetical protein